MASDAGERIRARIAEMEAIRENYRRYQADRVKESDHHGAWDAAVNLAETESELAGLRFGLEAMKRPPIDLDDPIALGKAMAADIKRYWPCPPEPHTCRPGKRPVKLRAKRK